MKTLAALAAVIAALGAIVASAVDVSPLPELPYGNCVRDLWPETDLDMMKVGAYEWQVYDMFGRRNTRPLLMDSIEPRRCVAFRYDEHLLDGPLALSIRLDDGHVTGRWLTEEPFAVADCEGLPRELIDLKGYYHAMACRGR